MKILSSKKQLKVMDLIFQAQMYAREDNFMKITDCLADIAEEVLTLGQLCFLKDAICKENKMTKQLSLYERFCEVWTRLYADDEIREILYGSDCKTMDEVETSLKRLEIIDRLNEKHCEDIQSKLDDFEWLKHKLNLTFLNSLSSPEDKMRVMKIMGVEYGKEN